MTPRSARSILLLCLTVAFALVLAVQPAAAFNENRNTGTTAEYTVNDDASTPGIACRYAGPKQLLDRIVIRRLWSHGPFARLSWVGFQYIIQRDAPPTGGGFRTLYRSPIVKKRANQTDVAFFSRSYDVPASAKGRFRVRLVLHYYMRGSSTNEIGRVGGTFQAYEHVASDGSANYTIGDEGNTGYCRKRFH